MRGGRWNLPLDAGFAYCSKCNLMTTAALGHCAAIARKAGLQHAHGMLGTPKREAKCRGSMDTYIHVLATQRHHVCGSDAQHAATSHGLHGAVQERRRCALVQSTHTYTRKSYTHVQHTHVTACNRRCVSSSTHGVQRGQCPRHQSVAWRLGAAS